MRLPVGNAMRGAAPVFVTLASITAIGLLFIPACGPSTKLLIDWGDPGYTAGPLRNVIVMVIRNDETKRRIWEDMFVETLRSHGTRATASYAIWPENFPDTLVVRKTMRSGGYDGVLVNLKTDERKETFYQPGTTTYQALGGSWDYWGAYHEAYEVVTTPGYTETEVIRTYRTDIWAASLTGDEYGRLVWTGMTQVTDSGSPNDVGKAFSTEVVNSAAKKGIF